MAARYTDEKAARLAKAALEALTEWEYS